MIRNSSSEILNVGAANRQIQGIYLWEKLGRERMVQIDALSNYGMYTVSFRRLPFTPLSQQPPRIASKGLRTRTVFYVILPMVHVPAHRGIDRLKRVTGNIC